MNWLKRKIRRWLDSEQDCLVVSSRPSRLEDGIDSDRGIRFIAYKAAGGMVVETNFYDRVKDRSHKTLHIITDDKDLGYEIGRIITMESLKI